MNIELTGYFDKNYGDDIMHSLIVEHFPEHCFFVCANEREMLAHLEKYPNVVINDTAHTADVYLNVTGTGFMYKGKRAKVEKLICMATNSSKKYPKSAVINCSFEPFDSSFEKMLVRKDLKKYNLITCRDGFSYKYIKSEKKAAEFHNDIVFANASPGEMPAEHILGIAPVRRLYDSSNHDYYEKLAQFCDLYSVYKNCKVFIFAFDTGLENDVSAALSVKKLMKQGDKAEIVMYNSDVNEFSKKIKQCSFIVGSRFHSVVEAYGSGIKSVGVYDRKKLSLLCDTLGIPAVSKEDFTPEMLMELAEKAKEPDIIDELKADALGHIRCLEKFLNG